jgi:hypothetical protein
MIPALAAMNADDFMIGTLLLTLRGESARIEICTIDDFGNVREDSPLACA